MNATGLYARLRKMKSALKTITHAMQIDSFEKGQIQEIILTCLYKIEQQCLEIRKGLDPTPTE